MNRATIRTADDAAQALLRAADDAGIATASLGRAGIANTANGFVLYAPDGTAYVVHVERAPTGGAS